PAAAAHARAWVGGVDAVVAGTGRQGQGLRDQLEVERAEDSLLRVAAFEIVEKPDRGRPSVRVVHIRYSARHENDRAGPVGHTGDRTRVSTAEAIRPAGVGSGRLNHITSAVHEVAGRWADRVESGVISQVVPVDDFA